MSTEGDHAALTLDQLRAQIDVCDDQLLALLNQRAAVSKAIGVAKHAADPNAPIYRPEREAQVLRRLEADNPGPLPGGALKTIFHEIMSASSALQRSIRVAYLGPRGTFSEGAARRQFGRAAELIACANFDEVFRRTETGETDFSVVPVENSTEGTVTRAVDLLLTSPLRVSAEVVYRVQQNLLRKGVSKEGIKRVYSHPQSLAQTQGWCARHLPGVEKVQVESNAEAARLASLEPDSAAIAGREAAEHYGLTMLAESIEDDPTNRTRFVVVGNHAAQPSGKDRTWLVMSAPNVAGAIHKLLTPFAVHHVSMTKIESRPARHVSMPGSWEYLFYVDLEGHQHEPHVAKALAELKAIAPYLKIFGSYPADV